MQGINQRKLREFGVTMAAAFFVISIIITLRHRPAWGYTIIVSAIFFLLSFTAPFILKPAYIVWMKLAFLLSWLNTRIILLVVFYLIFAPAGIILRLFKVDLLERKIDKEKQSYWRKKEPRIFNRGDYHRQF